jgi:hypothetical protein
MNYKVILESVDSPGRYYFIHVEDVKDLEDCVNQIRTEFAHEFTIDQITEVN